MRQPQSSHAQNHEDLSGNGHVSSDRLAVGGELAEGLGTERTRRRDAAYRRLLAGADVLSASFAVCLGVVVLGDDSFSLPLAGALPLVVFVSKTIGLYDRDEHLIRRITLDELPALFQLATLYALLIRLGESVFLQGHLGNAQLLALWALLFTSLALARTGARRLARASTPEERCLVVGDGAALEWVKRKLDGTPGMKARVVGQVPLEEREDGRDPPLLALPGPLVGTLASKAIDRVIISPGTANPEKVLDAIRLVKVLGVKVSVLPRLLEVVGSSVEFDDLHGLTLLGIRSHGLTQSSRRLKLALDRALAGPLLVALAPLMLLVAIAVKVAAPGPVLVRMRSSGRAGSEFDLLRFRTTAGIDGTGRMTALGHLLRRTSLDVLPTLVNVLRGQMSFVGPQPFPAAEADVGAHAPLLTPGLTGLSQVPGGARLPADEAAKLDHLYGANWSLWLDVKILLRTVSQLLLGGRAPASGGNQPTTDLVG